MIPPQGCSNCRISFEELDGIPVALKTEKKPGNPEDDRFAIELDRLQLGIPNTVKLLKHGVLPDNRRYMVLERLIPLEQVNKAKLINHLPTILDDVAWAVRQWYLTGYHWVARPKHVLLNNHNQAKLIDFNDDPESRDGFFDGNKYFDIRQLIESICKIAGVDYEFYLNSTITNLITREYQALQNVHQPIYFSPYDSILRRETDIKDPNYNKLVPANRKCKNRAKIIGPVLDKDSTILDIGCNVGWFCFYLESKGLIPTGIDFDKGKIDFANMIASLFEQKSSFQHMTVNPTTIENFDQFDYIMMLSILHLYILSESLNSTEWWDMIQILSKKIDKAFIFEMAFPPQVRSSLGIPPTVYSKIKSIGNFQSLEILGRSENGRDIVIAHK